MPHCCFPNFSFFTQAIHDIQSHQQYCTRCLATFTCLFSSGTGVNHSPPKPNDTSRLPTPLSSQPPPVDAPTMSPSPAESLATTSSATPLSAQSTPLTSSTVLSLFFPSPSALLQTPLPFLTSISYSSASLLLLSPSTSAEADDLISLLTNLAFSKPSFQNAASSAKQCLDRCASCFNQQVRLITFPVLVLTDSQYRFSSIFLLKNPADVLK